MSNESSTIELMIPNPKSPDKVGGGLLHDSILGAADRIIDNLGLSKKIDPGTLQFTVRGYLFKSHNEPFSPSAYEIMRAGVIGLDNPAGLYLSFSTLRYAPEPGLAALVTPDNSYSSDSPHRYGTLPDAVSRLFLNELGIVPPETIREWQQIPQQDRSFLFVEPGKRFVVAVDDPIVFNKPPDIKGLRFFMKKIGV